MSKDEQMLEEDKEMIDDLEETLSHLQDALASGRSTPQRSNACRDLNTAIFWLQENTVRIVERAMLALFLMLASLMQVGCFTAVSHTTAVAGVTTSTKLLTMANLGTTSNHATNGSGGITDQVTGDLFSEREVRTTPALPGKIVAGDIEISGTVDHSTWISEAINSLFRFEKARIAGKTMERAFDMGDSAITETSRILRD